MSKEFKNTPPTSEDRDWELFKYERSCYKDGYNVIAGIDEAGRGPLAGPVVSSAVILQNNQPIPGVFDSKKLTPKKRETLYEIIMNEAQAVGIGIVDPQIIDHINILQATFLSMRIALQELKSTPDMLLIDGTNLPGVTTKQIKIIKGDSKSQSIAAASIIAKVTRDRIMVRYHKLYPIYNFEKHKGYGTKEHLENIKRYGSSPIHRKTFKGAS